MELVSQYILKITSMHREILNKWSLYFSIFLHAQEGLKEVEEERPGGARA